MLGCQRLDMPILGEKMPLENGGTKMGSDKTCKKCQTEKQRLGRRLTFDNLFFVISGIVLFVGIYLSRGSPGVRPSPAAISVAVTFLIICFYLLVKAATFRYPWDADDTKGCDARSEERTIKSFVEERSDWQKNDCLASDCNLAATLQVVAYYEGNPEQRAIVRCCVKHIDHAKELACASLT